jgi:hypothetical protein
MAEADPETAGWLRVVMPDDVRRALMGSLCLLFYRTRDGEDVPVGSAFIIGATEQGALCMTATHVLVRMSKLEHPYPKSHPTSLFARESIDLSRPLREGRIGALVADGTVHLIAPVSVAYGSVEADISLIFVPFTDAMLPSFVHALAINTDVPVPGQRVVAASFFGAAVTQRADSTTYNYKFDVRIGTTTDVSQRGSRGLKGPSFDTTIPFEPGMSGGPVLIPPEKTFSPTTACGVISRGLSTEESFEGGSPGESTGAQLWPGLFLGFETHIKGVPQGRLSLLDYIKQGLVKDLGNSPAKVEIQRIEGEEYTVRRLDGK